MWLNISDHGIGFWITHVYEPDRNKKVYDVKVVHTMEKGQRYKAHPKGDMRYDEVKFTKPILHR